MIFVFFMNMSHQIRSDQISHSVVSDSLRSHGLYTPWHSPSQNTGVDNLSLLQGLFPTQESNPGLLHYRWIFLPAEPQGKPKNTGVGSLSLLQWILLTQESNHGLLHCRQILYQLSYEWKVPLVSLIFLKKSLLFPILLFSSISLHCSLTMLSYLSLLFFGTLHSDGYIFLFLLCL